MFVDSVEFSNDHIFSDLPPKTSFSILPLKGLGIGSGFVDPKNQVSHYSDFAFDSGLVGVAQRCAYLLYFMLNLQHFAGQMSECYIIGGLCTVFNEEGPMRRKKILCDGHLNVCMSVRLLPTTSFCVQL